MTASDLGDAFGHHVWATLQVMDACAPLDQEQLSRPIAGTYGSILDTLRHIVSSDAGYLSTLTGGRVPRIESDAMPMDQLRTHMEQHGSEWSTLLAGSPDPKAEVVLHRDDGTVSHAPVGIRLAQAIHHGSDHRSQVCTGLTLLGREPPEIDVWDFGSQDGRVFETS
jgi:uncharacterized damage-inducible protein DinB